MTRNMRVALLVLAGAGALAGCGDPKPPTDAEIAAESAKLPKQKPGRYTSITKLIDYDIPGASPQQADRFASSMRALTAQSVSVCVTQREIDQGFQDMLRELKAGTCKVDRFAVDGSALDAAATCTTVHGVISRIGIEGTVAAESTHTRLTMEQQDPKLPGGSLTMVLEVDGLREGDCPPVQTGT